MQRRLTESQNELTPDFRFSVASHGVGELMGCYNSQNLGAADQPWPVPATKPPVGLYRMTKRVGTAKRLDGGAHRKNNVHSFRR
jgi:hypothetical protein